MIDRLVAFSLQHRNFVVFGVIFLIIWGIIAFNNLQIDALPDVTPVQVQVITEVPGFSPLDIEKFITYPIEMQIMGLPKISNVRSLSRFGLSVVTVTFEDDMNIFLARQLVLEKLIEIKGNLPVDPMLAPISTGLGEIYQYTVESVNGATSDVRELMDLRTVQDWIIKPILKTIPGVVEVNSHGGYVKQYQVLVQPEKLIKYDVSLGDVFEAVESNNSAVGGNVIESESEQYVVRGLGLIGSYKDIENIVISARNGVPVYVRDVAQVVVGPETRYGAGVKDGAGEVVVGTVMMIMNGNAKRIVSDVKKKVEEINQKNILPEGIKIMPFYDRTELVDKAISTITVALREAMIIIPIVIYLFLRSFRGAFVVALSLPLAIFSTFIVMWRFGIPANLMSLGGIIVSLGMIADASIIQVENIQHHLSRGGSSKFFTVLKAVIEVRKPSLLGELIIAVTFIPIMTLEGMEGKIFSPLALSVVIALLSSLFLSIFVIPVLCLFLLKHGKERKTFIDTRLRQLYIRALNWAIKKTSLTVSCVIILFLASLVALPFVGTEFIPSMDEGSIAVQISRLPSVSLEESVEIEKKIQKMILEIPEVKTVVSKIGASDIATDPMGQNFSDMFVILKTKDEMKNFRSKREIVEEVRSRLEKFPGIKFEITQPIEMRVNEIIAGVRSDIAVKIFGEDMDVLRVKAEEVAQIISRVPGAVDVRVEQTAGQGYLIVNTNREKISKYGINVSDIQQIVETAIGGKTATEILEGDKKFSVVLRFPEEERNSIEKIASISVRTKDGANIPLGSVADVYITDGPVQITRENAKRRIAVECNVEGRDTGSFVREIQMKIDEELKLPAGYYITFGGTFEHQQRAMKRLSLVVPLSVLTIFVLLFITFNSFRYAFFVMISLPLALIGGIFGLMFSGQYISVPASVGFIALFGVAVLNGMVLVSYINKLREEGYDLESAIIVGCERRFRPVLMTASVAIGGLSPLLFASGPGAEIQKPLATVVISGLATSTILTLLVLPTIYKLIEGKR